MVSRYQKRIPSLHSLRLRSGQAGQALKLARTITDLAGDPAIQTHHLAEAIQYRPRRRE